MKIFAIDFVIGINVPNPRTEGTKAHTARNDVRRIVPGQNEDKGIAVEEHGAWFWILSGGHRVRKVHCSQVAYVEYVETAADFERDPPDEALPPRRGPGRPPKARADG